MKIREQWDNVHDNLFRGLLQAHKEIEFTLSASLPKAPKDHYPNLLCAVMDYRKTYDLSLMSSKRAVEFFISHKVIRLDNPIVKD